MEVPFRRATSTANYLSFLAIHCLRRTTGSGDRTELLLFPVCPSIRQETCRELAVRAGGGLLGQKILER